MRASFFVSLAVMLALGTITTTYTISAVILRQVPMWLTDITHSAMYVPTKFIFRIGMIPACCFMMLVWSAVGTMLKDYGGKVIRTLGIVSCCFLILSSSVIEGDGTTPWAVHIFGATGYFIISIITHSLVVAHLVRFSRDDGWSLLFVSELPLSLTGSGYERLAEICARELARNIDHEENRLIIGVHSGSCGFFRWCYAFAQASRSLV
jgi:hypothetical protein